MQVFFSETVQMSMPYERLPIEERAAIPYNGTRINAFALEWNAPFFAFHSGMRGEGLGCRSTPGRSERQEAGGRG